METITQKEITRKDFFNFVMNYIESDPEAAAYISEYVQAGLRAALQMANKRATDMECALAISLSERKSKLREALVKDILSKWRGKTSLNWDRVFEEDK